MGMPIINCLSEIQVGPRNHQKKHHNTYIFDNNCELGVYSNTSIGKKTFSHLKDLYPSHICCRMISAVSDLVQWFMHHCKAWYNFFPFCMPKYIIFLDMRYNLLGVDTFVYLWISAVEIIDMFSRQTSCDICLPHFSLVWAVVKVN